MAIRNCESLIVSLTTEFISAAMAVVTLTWICRPQIRHGNYHEIHSLV